MEKIGSIGQHLNISKEDIDELRQEKRRSLYLYPVIGAFLALIATLAGYITGKNADPKLVSSETGHMYPYSGAFPGAFGIGSAIVVTILGASAGVVGVKLLKDSSSTRIYRRRIILLSIILTILFAFIGFKVAFSTTQPVEYYTGAIKYDVYRDTGRID